MSVSTDGRVTQWNMKKGLEHVPLMNLKRVTNAKAQSADGKRRLARRQPAELPVPLGERPAVVPRAGARVASPPRSVWTDESGRRR